MQGRWRWVLWGAGGLVVAGGVESELAEEFTGGGVEDADVQVLNEEQDAGSGVGPVDADVVEPPAGAEADVADLADLVVADPVVGLRPGTAPRLPTTTANPPGCRLSVWPVNTSLSPSNPEPKG